MKTRLFIALSVVLFVGCRSHQELTQPVTPSVDSTAVDTVSTVVTREKKACFAANFYCDLSHVRLSGMLRMQEDSVIWFSLSKVIELSRAKLTPDSVTFYARATQQYFRGNYAAANAMIGYYFDFAQLQELLLSAYRERKRDVDLVMKGNTRQDTLHLVFTRYSTVREQSYPLAIPNRARPF